MFLSLVVSELDPHLRKGRRGAQLYSTLEPREGRVEGLPSGGAGS